MKNKTRTNTNENHDTIEIFYEPLLPELQARLTIRPADTVLPGVASVKTL